MKYEITLKDSECSPMLPGTSKLELGDIVSVTDNKNKTTHTFIVVDIKRKEVDVCEECDADRLVGCISVGVKGNRYDTQCAAPTKCVFKSLDSIMESL